MKKMNQSSLEAAMPYESAYAAGLISSGRPAELEVLEDGRLTTRVATTIEDVERFRAIWSTWTNGLDTDIDWYVYHLRNDSTAPRPYLIAVYDEGVPLALLVGQVRRYRMSATIARVRIPGPEARVLEIARGGRLGCQSSDIDKVLTSVLRKAIQNGDADVLCFQRLPLHSELFRELCKNLEARVSEVLCCSVLPLAAPVGDPASTFSGKTKRELRRKTRILQDAFPGAVRFTCFSQPDELMIGIPDATKVVYATWQYCFGYQCLNSSQFRDELEFFAKRGWLRIFVLYVEDLPCAFLVGQLYQGTFYCQHVGYDPNFAQFSVGSLLTARAFEKLAAAGVRLVDLGEGGREHFRRMGGKASQEGTVRVYSHTLPGIRAKVFFALMGAVREGARHTRSAFSIRTAA